MKVKLKNKILTMISSSLLLIAIKTVNRATLLLRKRTKKFKKYELC